LALRSAIIDATADFAVVQLMGEFAGPLYRTPSTYFAFRFLNNSLTFETWMDLAEKASMNEPQKYLRTGEAARYARLSGSVFAKMRCYGGGPRFAKIGRIVVYGIADLDAWLASKTFNSTSQYRASTEPAKQNDHVAGDDICTEV
jgi:hypothetical protein